MRVLQIGKFYPIRGGVEKVMWDLARGLAGRGADCDMVCASFEPQVISFGTHGRCICLKAWKKVAATMICPGMISYLRAHAGEYDIIHVHHPDPMAALALRLSGYRGRVIVHYHSDILKQKTLLTFYRPLLRWMLKRAEKIVGTTPVYVAQSPELRDFQSKVTFLPIGIEDTMKNGGEFVPGPEKTIFSLGRLVGYKGYEYLIEAAKFLPPSYRILIGGMGPLRESLEAAIDKSASHASVRLLGFLSDEEARGLFNGCDVFALPSVMKTEAFGIVQLEAMSCSKPVVATHIPGSGVDWVNADGESGLNVPPRDPRALADAILKLTSDSGTYSGYSRRARERFEKLFTFDRMIDGVLEIYGEN